MSMENEEKYGSTLDGKVDGCFEGEVDGSFEGEVDGSLEGKVDGNFEGEVDGSLECKVDGNYDDHFDGEGLDDLLNLDMDEGDAPSQQILLKKMKKNIGRQIYKRVAAALLALLLALTAGYVGLSAAMNACFYNPTTKSLLGVEEIASGLGTSDFEILLDTYLGLMYPGKYILPAYDQRHKLGFGSYEYRYKLEDIKWHMEVDGTYNSIFKVKRGKIDIELLSGANMAIFADTIYNPDAVERGIKDGSISPREDPDVVTAKDLMKIDEEFLKMITDLPDSASLVVNISFDETKTCKEIAQIMKDYPECNYVWAGVDDPYPYYSYYTDGINLNPVACYGLSEEAEKAYPGLYDPIIKFLVMSPEAVADKMEEKYLSSLKLLLDHKTFVDAMHDSMSGVTSYNALQAQYENIKENGIKVCALRMIVGKNDLLKMYEDGVFQYLYVFDATVSPLAR